MEEGQDVERYREQQRRHARFTPPAEQRRGADGETYEQVVDHDRCDREFEDVEAERIRAQWEADRDERAKQRDAERRRMTLGARLDHAVFEVELGKGLRARPIKAESNSADKANAGPAKPAGPELTARLRLIEHHVRMIERDADAEKGHAKSEPVGQQHGAVGGSDSRRFFSTEERDRIVWDDFQGVRSDVVAREAPYLGTSARTIERARTDEAKRRGVRVRPVTGEVLGDLEAAA
jgi:hypothetical protein